ncbi:hypothetical protein ACFUJ0_06310 [Streptomyces sp. NPDC057242]
MRGDTTDGPFAGLFARTGTRTGTRTATGPRRRGASGAMRDA